jgi:hypothetical protein
MYKVGGTSWSPLNARNSWLWSFVQDRKKSRGFVCAIAELEDTELELLFVLIPPCMSHNNNKTECE